MKKIDRQINAHTIKDRIPLTLLFLLLMYSNYVNSNQTQRLEDQLNVLKSRGLWMAELTAVLKKSSSDRWPSANAVKAWKQFVEANPEIKIPDDFEPFCFTPLIVDWPKIPKNDR